MDKPDTPQEYNDSTEQRIFDAAHEIFVHKGLDGAKMQEIADKAGINKALLHYYYRSKEKLYENVAKAVISKAVPVIQKFIETDAPLEEKLRLFVSFYIDLIKKNTFIPLFIISEINKHPDRFFETILPKELPKPEIFFKQVEDEIAKGNIRPIKPQHLLINVVSMCVFPFVAKPVMRMVLGMNPTEMNEFLEERKVVIVDFVLAAIKTNQNSDA